MTLPGTAAVLAAYLWGSIPSANALARLRGIDLREGGSGNPGANNALRLGGARLGVAVLAVEILKGFVAVWFASRIGGSGLAAAAGAAAIAGNVLNPWYRLKGGQGLGITAGVLLAGSPWSAAVGVAAAGAVAAALHSSPAGGLAGLTGAGLGLAFSETPWGLDPRHARWLVAATVLIVAPKQILNLRRGQRIKRASRQRSRGGSSPGRR